MSRNVSIRLDDEILKDLKELNLSLSETVRKALLEEIKKKRRDEMKKVNYRSQQNEIPEIKKMLIFIQRPFVKQEMRGSVLKYLMDASSFFKLLLSPTIDSRYGHEEFYVFGIPCNLPDLCFQWNNLFLIEFHGGVKWIDRKGVLIV